ncbi:Nif3-like dinuclear metal center hexameric protein [Oceanicoccus sagamiensis]|uniref:GTP cyclohydrolase 1 type 2 homolog n=1 Tax=Oceanicoccus sagamiensis TaxID=716816 RepID=A0A1X9NH79_9GAMM|nr:Nif3-like dinuclear metal center hexameric protein [Oceanicoccus sagamiensis]ARN74869.1 Nif3-like dinuclear metal center hexameric protein [Oceanicoccus sagamiensis]
MPVSLKELLSCTNTLLKPEVFNDYCPNGLQVQGSDTIQTLVAGVTASQALIDRAIAANADALLVHHGFFWKGEDPCVVGIKYRRLQALLDHNINLIAYHLPLDAHPVMGNNAQLANLLGLTVTGGLEPHNPNSVGNVGRLAAAMPAADFCQQVAKALGREPLLIQSGDHPIETIGWCTGAAQGYIDQAAMQGVDAYLSGEVSEPTVHSARELGVHYIAAGHHATERYGVQAVGEYLAAEFKLDYQFIDIDNPV